MPRSDQMFDRNWMLLFLAWFLATASTLGSLFFSEVMDFAPCILCWYQRIFMFPLVVILAAGLFPSDRSITFDKNVVRYSLPLAMLGGLTALYHSLMYAGIIPESLQPCSQGVSCTEETIDLLGFVTIPLLSFLSFSTIIALLMVLRRRSR
ncbi:MAG: disulfide bond formation protein B [Thermoanaerobaculia bacterium]|nr:disulfide bond formation protein B [Thermoanaerobaculia bacterium]